MQPCDDRIPALVDLAAGELHGPEREGLERHLAQCAGCRTEAALMAGVEAQLRRTNPPVDELFLASFAARTTDKAEQFRDRSLRGLWWSLAKATRYALGLSATALAASFALVIFAPRSGTLATHTSAPQPEVAAAETASDDAADGAALDLLGSREIGVLQPASDAAPTAASDDDAYDSGSLDQTLEGLSTEELDQLTQMLGQSPT